MYKRQPVVVLGKFDAERVLQAIDTYGIESTVMVPTHFKRCLLYTSDAADERSSVDLGGRRIIKKKITTTSG